MFSKACEYAIRAAIYITLKSKQSQRVSLKEIAEKINSPEAYTAKILQQLSKNKIIVSTRGPFGGFLIDDTRIENLRLSEIVDAIDGDNLYKGCGLGLESCSEEFPCPMHDEFKKVRKNLKRMLEDTLVSELSVKLGSGSGTLIR